MRKNKNEIVRLQSLIENDRISTGDNFINLILSDLTLLLRQYFDFKENVVLNIERSGAEYMVQINLTASRIKKFINIENI